ncbi:hypothetical protein J2Z79_002901 [Symbiobacterium terraclitae]|uniref:Uncharacterized protein n=1 Tax=Symbiobacterium terraclitae TaxID=557451 RepID=A0ABS4JV84_9FIRM|nr:hypothetical protein [Symbiobacterium terraclitae]MBP2019462.1 hypothetical protein [Symbiobacterium terraclitae]
MQQPVATTIPAGWPGMATYGLQAPSQAQPQAAPVAPVPFPASPYSSGQPQFQAGPAAQQPPNPAQMFTQQLVQTAKSLEQLFPGYQALLSLLLEASSTAPSPALQEAVRSVEEGLYYHGATLGAIRRMLCGEATPSVLTALATGFHRMNRAQPRVRAAAEQVLSLVPSARQSVVGSLVQSVAMADGVLGQVGNSIRSLVGPQAWESAREA